MNRVLSTIISFLFLVSANAQDDKPKNWIISGYVKDMQTLYFVEASVFAAEAAMLSDNLIHNRINYKWYVNDHFTFKADLRSRIFWGDFVKTFPGFIDGMDEANDYFDLSWSAESDKGLAFHTMLDRFYLEYVKDNWEIRLGRQRVNWGINTVWNPNDAFNAYSFTDFDYEEKPGTDALRVKYYTGFASSVEVAINAFDTWEEAVIAGLWKFNKWNYDFQILGGVAHRDVILGGGWAGNIKNAGLKGEFTYFHDLEEDGENSFAATLGFDYVFSNSLYLNTGFLFNSSGTTKGDISELFSFELSAKNLYPYKYALFTQTGFPITPLVNSSLALIYSPSKSHALFINPVITVSLAENLDFDAVGQIMLNNNNGYVSPIQAVFLRVKYSY